ncbi:hypothetical protein GCM10009696_36440 [Kocuria himachalensis]
MVQIEVIAPHTGGEQVRHLPVCILLPHRHTGIPDQLPHVHPLCLATNVEYLILGAWIKYIAARQTKPRKHAEANFSDETSRNPNLPRQCVVDMRRLTGGQVPTPKENCVVFGNQASTG